jgi:AraC-like DNA-binding protein
MTFVFDEHLRLSDSPFIESIWSARSEDSSTFTSLAATHCELVVMKQYGKTIVTMRGPETKATPAYCPPDGEWIGIVFKLGTYMPHLPAQLVMDRRDLNLPEASSKSFWLQGSAWEFPNFDNADTFVNRLVRDGLLVRDRAVEAALAGEPQDLSIRTLRRRFLRATGLTPGTIMQIERARQAMTLLQGGVPILDTVYEAGFYDQPHLTRALKHFVGQTPAQIITANRMAEMSLLYNTELVP